MDKESDFLPFPDSPPPVLFSCLQAGSLLAHSKIKLQTPQSRADYKMGFSSEQKTILNFVNDFSLCPWQLTRPLRGHLNELKIMRALGIRASSGDSGDAVKKV